MANSSHFHLQQIIYCHRWTLIIDNAIKYHYICPKDISPHIFLIMYKYLLLYTCHYVPYGTSRFIMTAEFALDQVLANNAYKFKTLYESSKIDMEEITDSPFSQLVNDWYYYEQQEFHDKCKSLSCCHLICL